MPNKPGLSIKDADWLVVDSRGVVYPLTQDSITVGHQLMTHSQAMSYAQELAEQFPGNRYEVHQIVPKEAWEAKPQANYLVWNPVSELWR